MNSSSLLSRAMHKRNRAQALIEFVLIVPVMLVILLGMIDLGRAFVFGVSVQNGAREAARLAEISATDQTVSDSAVLTRLIAASNPALIGCGATLGNPLSCGGGTWTFTIDVTTPAPYNQHYTSISVAKADAHFSGSQITVTARGSVSMLAGLHFGWGDNLFPIFAQGQASMAVF